MVVGKETELTQVEIARALAVILGQGHIPGLFAILYGSRISGRDIDIVIVQPNEPSQSVLRIGQVDLFVLSMDRCQQLLSYLDPVVTEPILSGAMLLGDVAWWNKTKAFLRGVKPGKKHLEYLARRSIEETFNTKDVLYRCHAAQIGLIRASIRNLSFAISYLSFAQYYAQKQNEPCCLARLIESGKILLPEFWSFLKHSKDDCTLDQASEWLRRWESFIYLSVVSAENQSFQVEFESSFSPQKKHPE